MFVNSANLAWAHCTPIIAMMNRGAEERRLLVHHSNYWCAKAPELIEKQKTNVLDLLQEVKTVVEEAIRKKTKG